PMEIVEIRCQTPGEVAAAMRELRIRGAPVLGQVAAYGLWQAAEAQRQAAEAQRQTAVGNLAPDAGAPGPAVPVPASSTAIPAAAEAFRSARPGVAPLRRAVARALAAWQAVGGDQAAPEVVADRLKAEADAIAMEALLGQARLGRTGAAALPRPRAVGGRVRILTIDETGALAGGTVGTALGVVTTAAAEGRALEVIVAETRPSLTGARLAAWELALAGVPYRVVADGAAAGLIAAGDVDIVLVGAEAVAADGAALAPAGTYPLALAAARAGVPFVVCTGSEAIDPDLAGAAELRPELRRLVAGSLAEPDSLSGPAADDTSLAAQPLHDITPPDLISAFVTDEGLLHPPYGQAFAGLAWPAR
ncbi:MAG TPA: hypothetical protein VFW92_04165, partial [Candidatus Limnocylindrales bacterium]|nr:hypothetical protein [Candidatus Limnocylindrales bacterium]